MGHSSPRMFCDKTTPKPELDALVCTMNGCVKSGLMSTEGPVRASLSALNAALAEGSQRRIPGLHLVRRSVSGVASVAKFWMNRL